MSDPNSPHIKKRDTPSWGLYQRENFWKLNDGQVPPFNTRKVTARSEINGRLIVCRSR